MTNIIGIAVKDIKSNIMGAFEDSELIAHVSYGKIITDQLDEIVVQSEIVINGDNVHNSSAMKLISGTQQALATAELLSSVLSPTIIKNSVKNSASKAYSWVVGSLIPWLKNLMNTIWAIIQTLFTPTEWKIKGELGTSVLGLAKAELEISFGK
jgi:hypothetical protein